MSNWKRLTICFILIAACTPTSLSINQVVIKPNPKDPFNPRILVNSSRPETHYEGPLHTFDTVYSMRHISLKIDMAPGQHECYYFVLIKGYQLTLFAASVAEDDNKFHVFVSNSDPDYQRIYSDQTSVSLVENITQSDTYEVCLINPHSQRSVMFSVVYYQPARYEAEVREAIAKTAIVTNISDVTSSFISNIEINVGMALNSIRYQPNLRRDYVILRDSNSYVQWKSIAFICLMLLSSGGTTLFIHYLFHVPKGKLAI